MDDSINPRLKQATLLELMTEALARIAHMDARTTQKGLPERTPERVQWMTEDAPSAGREARGSASDGGGPRGEGRAQ